MEAVDTTSAIYLIITRSIHGQRVFEPGNRVAKFVFQPGVQADILGVGLSDNRKAVQALFQDDSRIDTPAPAGRDVNFLFFPTSTFQQFIRRPVLEIGQKIPFTMQTFTSYHHKLLVLACASPIFTHKIDRPPGFFFIFALYAQNEFPITTASGAVSQ
jgi:hypothetical protein